MSEDLIIKHCSPTLAGIKTGNLFSTNYNTKQELKDFIARLNRIFSNKGVQVIPLKFGNGRVLIYVFRPSLLASDLSDEYACKLLKNQGYHSLDMNSCIAKLKQRVSTCTEFPHEIGLFLGYPPEDVYGFILHKGSGCKCAGLWKVYGDEEQAVKKFNKFRKCSDIYYSKWLQGTTLQKLTVTTLK
ncbi:MAG: DUF3793 family protein [Ruminococcus sp.]|nr:DUF3793 family protein [Ruminococcus sp.]